MLNWSAFHWYDWVLFAWIVGSLVDLCDETRKTRKKIELMQLSLMEIKEALDSRLQSLQFEAEQLRGDAKSIRLAAEGIDSALRRRSSPAWPPDGS